MAAAAGAEAGAEARRAAGSRLDVGCGGDGTAVGFDWLCLDRADGAEAGASAAFGISFASEAAEALLTGLGSEAAAGGGGDGGVGSASDCSALFLFLFCFLFIFFGALSSAATAATVAGGGALAGAKRP